MEDIFNFSCTVGAEACDNKRCACSEVRRLSRSTCKVAYTLNHSHIAVNGNICAHTAELVNITEAVIKNAFINNARTLGKRQQCSKLRLHICGEARVRHSLYSDSFIAFLTDYTDAVVIFHNNYTDFAEL